MDVATVLALMIQVPVTQLMGHGEALPLGRLILPYADPGALLARDQDTGHTRRNVAGENPVFM